MKRRLHPATVVVEAGRPVRTPGAPVNSPIVMSSTYVGHEQPGPGELVYARIGTESWEPLEEALGHLENAGRPGLLFASGMAAISAALDLTPSAAPSSPRATPTTSPSSR
ncbi:PLP-dependent transferase [Serinibacter arcticus]|uniref:PLP-dependent transferase n=1 Tax=Serinibacter arcticus TaxID=1655435 RepID=UPI0026997DCA